jgi:hypothetical protein
MFWIRALFAIAIGAVAVLLTHPLSSFASPTAYFNELSTNTGHILLWVLALVGAAGVIAKQFDNGNGRGG